MLLNRRELGPLFAFAPWARTMRLTRYELWTVRVPFAERVREAWIESWKKQKLNAPDSTMS